MLGSTDDTSPLNMMVIGVTIIFGILYVAVASIGVKTYNKCDSVQGVKKWDSVKMLLSHTMTVSLMIPFVLIAQHFVGSKVASVMAIIYGIMGLVGSASSFALTREDDCGRVMPADSKNYLIAGMVMSILLILGGGALLSRQKNPNM